MTACHRSRTTVAPGSVRRCSRPSPASPSHSTVAGVSAHTPAAASACAVASAEAALPLRAKAKRGSRRRGARVGTRDRLEGANPVMPPLSSDDGEGQAEAGRGDRDRTRVGRIRLGHFPRHMGFPRQDPCDNSCVGEDLPSRVHRPHPRATPPAAERNATPRGSNHELSGQTSDATPAEGSLTR
jgi:hypothetical protein